MKKRLVYLVNSLRKEKEAKKLYQAFYFAERDRIEKEESSQESINEYNESNILSDSSLDDAGSDTASDEDNDDTPKPEGTAQDEASMTVLIKQIRILRLIMRIPRLMMGIPRLPMRILTMHLQILIQKKKNLSRVF